MNRPTPQRWARCAVALTTVGLSSAAGAAEFWDRAHAPPAPRSAQVLHPGDLSIGLAQPVELGVLRAQVYTRAGTLDERMPMEWMWPALSLHAGVGPRVEVGITAALRTTLRWSLLDETQHHAPLSVALATEVGWTAGGLGLQLSRDHALARAALRPTLGLWLAYHRWAANTRLPPSGRTPSSAGSFVPRATPEPGPDPEASDPMDAPAGSLRIESRGFGLMTPIGLEVDLPLGPRAALVPALAWQPMFGGVRTLRARCAECFAGLGPVDRIGLGTAWVGVRLEQRQPRTDGRRKADDTPARTPPAAEGEAPTPPTAPSPSAPPAPSAPSEVP